MLITLFTLDFSFYLSYGSRVVLDGVSCTVAPGEKAGLIGVNGAGKSSLFKIIAGIQDPDRGNVVLPRSYGYLSQDVANETSVADGITVRDYIFSSTGLDAAIRSFEELSLQLAGAEGDRLSSLLQRFEQAQDTLDRLLFQAPDLLLLDEPTNFLDVEATAWLMDLLDGYPGALLIISHDLDLLDRSITKMLRLNEFTHKLEEYHGTYSNYLIFTGDAIAELLRRSAQHEREITRLRKTSQKLRGFGATRVSQRVAFDKRIVALEASKPNMPQARRRIKIDFPMRTTCGQIVLRADKLAKTYGAHEVFRDLSFQVEREQRLVVIGPNGAGKNT